MPAILPRSSLQPRGLSSGAKAGISVGSIVGAALILLCLWPIVARFLRRRRRKHASTDTLSAAGPEAFEAPPMGLAHTDSDDRRMSTDSYMQRPGARPPRRQSTKELTLSPLEVPPAPAPTSHPVSQVPQSEPPSHQPSISTTPATPLTDLDAAQLARMVEMAERRGYSDSYYNTEIPTEAFGLNTTESKHTSRSRGTRSSSKRSGSSIFDALFRRNTGSKDASAASQPTYGTAFPQPADIADIGFSESPTELEPPPNALSRTSEEQSRAVDLNRIAFPTEASPPIPPPALPSPGTVNPMDVMGATTSTEQTWLTNAELMNLTRPPPNPIDSSDTPTPNPATSTDIPPPLTEVPEEQPRPNGQAASPLQLDSPLEVNGTSPLPSDEAPNIHENSVNGTTMEFFSDPQFIPVEPVPQVNLHENPPHLMALYTNGVPDQTHHFQHQHHRHPSSSENNYTDNSAYSTPFPAPSPSGVSSLNTPDTRISDATPSPKPFYSPESRIQSSPNPAFSQSPPQVLICDKCGQKFDQPHKLNHHKRYHDRPHVCERPGCGKRFGTKTHLDRHINDKHEQTRRYHCPEPTCPYSRQGGKSFPRKDNLRRHMMNIHRQSPQPDQEFEFVDVVMAGS